ncbi:MAG: acyltransferase, partial [Methanomicrobiales archaeon]|nr:acyltransferase [Methanomicrobiales archaeon]
ANDLVRLFDGREDRCVVLVVWIRELDYLRGFAALAVIAVHISMHFTLFPGVSLPALLNAFVYVAAHFAVPVFMFISGWVLALRYSGEYSLRTYYRRRARMILPAYLFFTALYLLIPVEGAIHLAGMPDPGAVVSALLTGTAAYHLWFFVVIIQLYILYPLIIRGYDAFDRAGAALYLLLTLLFFQILWNVGAHAAGAFAGADWYLILARAFPSHLFYFILGIHVSRHTGRFRSVMRSISPAWVAVAAGIGALLVGGVWVLPMLLQGSLSSATLAVFSVYRIVEPLYYVPVIILLAMVAMRLEEAGGLAADSIRTIGKHSFGIYLIHPLIIAAFAAAWISSTGMAWTDWMTYPVLFFVTAAASYGIVRFVALRPGRRER